MLQVLSLGDNQLTGPLPGFWGGQGCKQMRCDHCWLAVVAISCHNDALLQHANADVHMAVGPRPVVLFFSRLNSRVL